MKAQNLTSNLPRDKVYITYQLTFSLRSDRALTVGKLGTFQFLAGDYIYTGSAKQNMKQRLERHLKKTKPLRWHIDYLLTLDESIVKRIELFTESECRVNACTKGNTIVHGFGASDCRSHCKSHLKFLGMR